MADKLVQTGDELTIADRTFKSRLFLGSSKYPSFDVMVQAIEAAETELVTVAVRYMNLEEPEHEGVWIPPPPAQFPDPAQHGRGDDGKKQAVRMAHLAREATGTRLDQARSDRRREKPGRIRR